MLAVVKDVDNDLPTVRVGVPQAAKGLDHDDLHLAAGDAGEHHHCGFPQRSDLPGCFLAIGVLIVTRVLLNTLNDRMLMVTYVRATVSECTYDTELRGEGLNECEIGGGAFVLR